VTWHSDVTYEKQPPGTTFLYLLDGPAAGGDTLFANQAEAYRRLSPEFQKRLHGLKASHSGKPPGFHPLFCSHTKQHRRRRAGHQQQHPRRHRAP